MVQSVDVPVLVRNLSVYTIGVAGAVAGALGLVEAIELPAIASWVLFVGGLVIVVLVHEYFGGPI